MSFRSISGTSTLVLILFVLPAQQALAVMAGSNMYIDYNEELDVPYSGFAGQYFLDPVLIHSPWAGPFFKIFESPITDTLDPILLDGGYHLKIFNIFI